MFHRQFGTSSVGVAGGALLGLVLLGSAAPVLAASESAVWSFKGAPDGAGPTSELVADPNHAGVFYGTTELGGASDVGTVFQLTKSGASWNVSVIFSFTGSDGWHPLGALAIDTAGNLYGTTQGGGSDGEGEVFELSPPAGSGKPWTLTQIYGFQNETDGGNPESGVTFDSDGNLYGTTDWGGNPNQPNGVVYKLSPQNGGGWTYKVLHSFDFNDGGLPVAAVAIDGNGTIFGTTFDGGVLSSKGNGKSPGNGVVYSLTPGKKGKYTYTILHTFSGLPLDGSNPAAPVAIGPKGVLYGTAKAGGTDCGGFGCGDVFSLTPAGKGAYTYKLLYHFTGGIDGSTPLAGVLLSGKNLFGTASAGGTKGNGSVFELTGGKSFHLIHDFAGGSDGATPQAGVIPDGNGNLLGTTEAGGGKGQGTVFSATP